MPEAAERVTEFNTSARDGLVAGMLELMHRASMLGQREKQGVFSRSGNIPVIRILASQHKEIIDQDISQKGHEN